MDALFNSGFECRTEVLMDRGFQPCDRQAYTNDDFDGMGISAGRENVNRNMDACIDEVTHRYFKETSNE